MGNSAKRVAVRLPTQLRQVGAQKAGSNTGHRAGWPYVLSFLKHDPQGVVLFDDFVERTYEDYRKHRSLWACPWVGCFHHPPNMPRWFNENQTLDRLFASQWWHRVRPFMIGAVALSEYLADYLRATLNVPVGVVKHPTMPVDNVFTWEKFEANPRPKVIQVGWYLRNYKAIYQMPVPDWIGRAHLRDQAPWIQQAWRRTDEFSQWRDRPVYPGVQVIDRVSNEGYDELLSCNLVGVEFFDTSANNAVVEAIVRNTPLVVNNHRAVREYLGEEYPLYFDEIDEVYALLQDKSRVLAAYEYLRDMDKSDLTGEAFAAGVGDFIQSVQPISLEGK